MKTFRVTNMTTGDEDEVRASYFILKNDAYLLIRKDENNPDNFETVLGVPSNIHKVKLIEECHE